MTEIEKLEQSIAALETQRPILGDAVVEAVIGPLRQKLADLKTRPSVESASQQRRKQVTVLFADVSGFTALSESLDAEDLAAMMNALWQRLDAIILRNGGHIDKHIGDAVMALWGAEASHEDDPERAIRTALEMQVEVASRPFVGRIQRLLAALPGPLPAVAFRIGIHTGPVVLGAVGSRGEFTAMGDTVNVAARLETAAPIGSALISYETFRAVRGVFNVEALEPLEVRGRTEPVRVYRVISLRPRAFRLGSRGVEGVETSMVGRQDELARVKEAVRTVVSSGRCCALTVVGEAGLGKSRLMHEFQSWQDVQRDSLWLFKGRASEQMRDLPYALLRDLLSTRFEIADSDSLADARRKLLQGMASFMPDDPEAEVRAHFIGHLIGLDFSASPHLRGILSDPRQLRSRAMHYLTEFFRAVVADGPAMLLLEDLQWADDGSIEAISHLAQSSAEIGLFIMANTRPVLYETHPDWGQGWPNHQRLDLQPLSEAEVRSLVSAIFARLPNLPAALSDLVVSSADGNPFYVEELIKMWIDEGVVMPGEETWQVDVERLTAARPPASLTGVLQARLDSLPDVERAALQRAAIFGRVFWDDALVALRDDGGGGSLDRPALTERLLPSLARRELVFRRDETSFAGTGEYIFKHTMLREVAYETVLKRQRRLYHAQAAAWLTERAGERAAEFAGLIAGHYEQAGDPVAGGWHARAAEHARRSYGLESALTHYRKAFELADPADPGRTDWLAGFAQTLWLRAYYDESMQAYDSLYAAADAAGDPIAAAAALTGRSACLERRGEFRDALESARQAAELANRAGDPGLAELANALYHQGWGLYRLGELEQAIRHGEHGLMICPRLPENDALRQQARINKLLGAVYQVQGRFALADQHTNQSLVEYRAIDDQSGVCAALNNLGVTAHWRGDYAAAIRHYSQALAFARQTADRDSEIILFNNLGGARAGYGEYIQAEADLLQALSMMGGGHAVQAETYRFLAEAYLGQNRVEPAFEAARQALEIAQRTGWQEVVGVAWRALANCSMQLFYARQNNLPIPQITLPDPRTCFGRSLDVLASVGVIYEQARTRRDWARFEWAWGDPDQARALWLAALADFRRMGMALAIERMRKERPEVK